MRIIVIDGQGGGIGRSLVEQLKKQCPQHEVLGVGINAIATAAMVKAGADGGATGESAVCYNCAHADVIVGPIGLVLVGSMLGEVSAAIAAAVPAVASASKTRGEYGYFLLDTDAQVDTAAIAALPGVLRVRVLHQ